MRWDLCSSVRSTLSRLAKDYRVLYFEEPVRGKQTPFLQRFTPCPNVEVLRPHTTVDAVGFHDDQLPELKPLLAEYLSDFSIDDYLVWFYADGIAAARRVEAARRDLRLYGRAVGFQVRRARSCSGNRR